MKKHSGWITGPPGAELSKFIMALARTNGLNFKIESERLGWWIFKYDRITYSVQGEDWRDVHNFIIAVRGYVNRNRFVQSSTEIASMFGV